MAKGNAKNKTSPALVKAAAELEAVPSDLTAWWRLCAALGAAGETKEAFEAMRKLGLAAAQLGQVALAAACARGLAADGKGLDSKAVVDRIAALHAAGSEVIDKQARRLPPPRIPTGVPVAATAAATTAEAVGAARRAIASAEAMAADRTPSSYAPTPLITALEADDVGPFIASMELREFAVGDVLVAAGAPAKSLFWLARGAVEVVRHEASLGVIRANAFFGEIALVGATVRTATVKAIEPTVVLELSADAMEQAASKAPKLARLVARYARARLLDAVMRTSDLFSRLSADERTAILPRFTTQIFESGSALIAKDTDNAALFVLAAGTAEVRDGHRIVASLGPGDGVGEMSLLSQQPAMADVVATAPVIALRLDKAAFDEIGLAHPGLLAEVYRLKLAREDLNRGDVIHDAAELIV